MRYMVEFVFVLALVASPMSVSAQTGEEGAQSEPRAEEPAPPSEPAPEEPALQLKLDEAGVGVVSPPPRPPDGYTLEEMELRVKRARIGLFSTVGVTGVGLVLFGVGLARMSSSQDLATAISRENLAPWFSGMGLMISGAVGMIVTGTLLGIRKDELRSLQDADYGGPRRAQWDLAQSRLVF